MEAGGGPAASTLVTGGAGFVGTELVRQLVDAGERVRVLDDFSVGRRDDLPAAGVEIIAGDVGDPTVAAEAVDGIDVVFHLACVNLRRSLVDPHAAHVVNAGGTLCLLEAVRDADLVRFVHVSSSEVYGSARQVPMDEAHVTQPTTPYGASKLAGEAYARAHHLSYGVPVVIVRPFNACGPGAHHAGDSGEVLPRFVLRALAGRPLPVCGDGSQRRDFTHVTDTARGIRAAATAPIGATYNLGTGSTVSVLELAQRVLQLVGAPGSGICHQPARPGDVEHLCADASAARRDLGFAPTRTLEAAIEETADRLRADPRGLDALLDLDTASPGTT